MDPQALSCGPGPQFENPCAIKSFFFFTTLFILWAHISISHIVVVLNHILDVCSSHKIWLLKSVFSLAPEVLFPYRNKPQLCTLFNFLHWWYLRAGGPFNPWMPHIYILWNRSFSIAVSFPFMEVCWKSSLSLVLFV